MDKPKIFATCQQCGKPFRALTKKFKYCSSRCLKIAKYQYQRKPEIEKQCDQCRNTFKTHRANKRFCSTECHDLFHKLISTTMYEKICPQCKDPFVTSKSNKKYCSHDCYLAANKAGLYAKREEHKNAISKS